MRQNSRFVRHLLATTAVVAMIYGAEPAVAQTFDWTGPYVGVNLGYMQNTQSRQWSDPTAFQPVVNGTAQATGQGFVGGIQGGYNYQFPGSHFVLGGEADFDLASGSKTSGGAGCCGEGFGKTKISALGTVRGRFGYAADRALFFGTAGLAFADVRNTASLFGNTVAPFPADSTASRSGWRAGWVAGGGVEYAFSDHCLLKVEALYADLGKSSATNSSGCTVGFKNTMFLTRVGVAWKF
jgi:outer membrane immunogenic protein